MDFDKIKENIKKTGFELEYRISEILKSSKWNVINKRYYIDDQEEKVREIDLVAYKIRKTNELRVCTTLIISCKKSENNAWALFSKNIDPQDPNFEWLPLHQWTNNKALRHMMYQQDWSEKYFTCIQKHGLHTTFGIPQTHIFAFQEINKKSAKIQNDRSIFNSITSLMKAQAYELETLPRRRKEKAFYSFNLLSIVDSDLVRIDFTGDSREVVAIDETRYVADYIIYQNRTFSTIHFIKAAIFEDILRSYCQLHLSHCNIVKESLNSYYEGVLEDENRINVYRNEFINDIRPILSSTISNQFKQGETITQVDLGWDKEKGNAVVKLNLSQETIDYLNNSDEASSVVRKALCKLYKCSDDFEFAAK